MGMEPRSLTRMIKSLEEKGWIERKPDKRDKRMVKIFLTKEGENLRKKTRDYVIKFNERIYEEIDDKDLMTCFKVLKHINKLIDRNNIFNN